MPRIRVLPTALINRIAAGECIERPASVAKELLENALDAGAGRIDVAIEDGGRERISVADDGGGMAADELRLAVAPHATSKLETDDDLFNIHTLGFRGEALASIGSVSRLAITSRPPGSDIGAVLRVDAGEISGPAPCAAPPGTRIEVRDLFYCLPARRKFLRSNQTESGHVTEQLARIALAHPGVAFTLQSQSRVVHRLDATSQRLQRIADFFDPELTQQLLPIEREGDRVRIEGYVAPPAHCRRSSKWEYVFVNGRFIRDRFVSHAIKEAYRSLIQPDEYPVAFLYITIAPDLVDVNVHPTKIEVRWRDSNYVHGQVLAALRDKFLSTNLDRRFGPVRAPQDEDAYRQRVRTAMVDYFTHARPAAPVPQQAAAATAARAGRPAADVEGAAWSVPDGVPAGSGAPWVEARGNGLLPSQAVPTLPGARDGAERESLELAEPGQAALPLPPEGVPRAMQFHNTYLAVETADGVMLIDQHALHERILYEEFRRRIAEKPLESQRLLLPLMVSVPADRIEPLETHAATLARLGLDLAAAGPQTVAVHAFPSLLDARRFDAESFVRDLLDLLSEPGSRPGAESLLHEALDMMACKAAVKAGDALTADEITALLSRREIADRSSHCPHGRPTTLHLTLRELERQFKRR
ncbi:DNA mismatch repair protein MutL [Phycisphaerae bacterium RAS1]|nr:DNA mismatch repair protein MutL [Phycisphaerae bacterium RAS1]